MSHDEDTSLKVVLVGDVMLGRLVNEVLKFLPAVYPWGDTLPLFQQADVRLCNLECAISDRGTPWSATPKVFHFRSDARNVAALKAAHIDAVSLANNHILDFNVEGLLDTLAILKQAGIHTSGAGTTFEAASQPAIWEVRGRKIGFIAITDNEPVWAASRPHPGTWYVPICIQEKQALHLFQVVQQTKALVSYLIVSTHWGPNWGSLPLSEHLSFAHALIDHGADLIFGHSGHIVRGIELYRGKPILYCAGDFIDDYAVHEVERNDQSFLFLIELRDAHPSHLYLYPTIIRNEQARRASGDECKTIVARMQKLCTQLNTTTQWNAQEARLEIAMEETHKTGHA